MLPPEVDPRSWIYGVPFTLACLSFYRLPMQHRAVQSLQRLVELDSYVLSSVLAAPPNYCPRRSHRKIQAAAVCLATVFGLFSLASFAQFVARWAV